MNAQPLILELPDGALDAIAERVLERLARTEPGDVGYLNVAGACDFLACNPSRVYALVSAGRLPHEKDGSRLLFERAALREYVKAGGAKRP